MASVAGNGLHLSGRSAHGERDRESGTHGVADGVWERVRARLRGELGEEVYSSWFARAELVEVSGGTAQLSVPTRFLKSWIMSHYGERLVALMQAERDDVHRLEISVRTAATARGQAAEAAAPASREDMVQGAQAVAAAIVEIESDGELIGSPLDARYTFETYRVGRANTLAAAAARKVAENGGLTFNPLYVHSAVGLGKTHLLQAIAWEGQKAKRPRRVVYLTAERFVYRFVAALRANTGLAFKDQLRGIDVLLIDDMQFLQGKATQTEFCHLLNALIDAGKQVVVAADRPPSDLESLDERVRSRLAGGLVAEMAAPDESLRCEILAAKAVLARGRYAKLDIPEDVLRYVARHVAGNGRDLDGAFTRLLAHNQLTGAPVTVDLAERVIRDLVRQSEPKRVRIEDIQRVVSKHYNVSRTDLVSARRTRTIVKPRQIAMYLAKIMTPRSLPEIGRRFGGRDHTTVLHAVRKIDGLVKADQHLAEEVEVLKRSIEQ